MPQLLQQARIKRYMQTTMRDYLDDAEHSVCHRTEIIHILKSLKKDRVAIKLSTLHGEEFVTSVLDVNHEKDHVYLDLSEKAYSRIIDSTQVTFTYEADVWLKWHSTPAMKEAWLGGNAFAIPVPAVVQRIKRRECFRLPLPQGSQGLICRIPVLREMLEVPVKDISVGGIGLVLKGFLHPGFAPGDILDGCSIEFPAAGMVHFKLKVCGIQVSQNASGEDTYHVGTEFMGLSRGVDNVVQRYMMQMEVERSRPC